jgi:hypothetical protein
MFEIVDMNSKLLKIPKAVDTGRKKQQMNISRKDLRASLSRWLAGRANAQFLKNMMVWWLPPNLEQRCSEHLFGTSGR